MEAGAEPRDAATYSAVAPTLLAEGISIRFRVGGASMLPTLRPGDVVTVEPLGSLPPRPGEIVLCRAGSGFRVHRVVRRRAAGASGAAEMLLRGDALDRCDLPAPEDDVLGRVVAAERDGCPLAVTGIAGRCWALRAEAARLRRRGQDRTGAPTHAAEPAPDLSERRARAFLALLAGDSTALDPGFLSREECARLLLSHGSVPPAPAFQRERRVEAARNLRMLAALREAVCALDAAGIHCLALKGAAALVWLYLDPGRRRLSDLDLLVAEDDVAWAGRVLESLGYAPIRQHNSAESAWLYLRAGGALTFTRRDGVRVELHTRIDAAGGGIAELRARSRAECLDGVPVHCLSPEDFILHAALHHARHSESDFASLAGVIDIVECIQSRGDTLDWTYLWSTAESWGVASRIAPLLAGVHEYTPLSLPVTVPPLSALALVSGKAAPHWRAAERPPEIYRRRLRGLRELPDNRSRLRYLVRLVIPEEANLRHRYAIPPGRAALPYYLWHPCVLAARLVSGLAASAFSRR